MLGFLHECRFGHNGLTTAHALGASLAAAVAFICLYDEGGLPANLRSFSRRMSKHPRGMVKRPRVRLITEESPSGSQNVDIEPNCRAELACHQAAESRALDLDERPLGGQLWRSCGICG